MRLYKHTFILCLAYLSLLLFACKTGTGGLFKPSSPHEQYQRKLVSTGFDKTAAGIAWINAARKSIEAPLEIALPFKERGYFAAENIPAIAYTFNAVKGQKINITISQKPVENFRIYVDLMLFENQKAKSLAFIDTTKTIIDYEIEDTGNYLVRLQPELLTNGEYTLEINSGPSLSYPVKTTSRNNIQSFFGDGRDANSRKHEGIDLFAPFQTPVIAAAAGTVTRVNENNLGGKVVWMRPAGKNYTLYYAHLDRQIAVEGQQVLTGDTLGLMGNTGNAKTTAPHLHFGIYGPGGAVDPLPFVNPVIKPLPEVLAAVSNLNSNRRTKAKASVYNSVKEGARTMASLPANTVVRVDAANRNWYRIELQDGQAGFIRSSQLNPVEKSLRTMETNQMEQVLFDRPDSTAAIMATIPPGSRVEILGYSNDYSLIRGAGGTSGWLKTRR